MKLVLFLRDRSVFVCLCVKLSLQLCLMYDVSFLVVSLPAYMLAVVSQIELMVLSVKLEIWWAAGV